MRFFNACSWAWYMRLWGELKQELIILAEINRCRKLSELRKLVIDNPAVKPGASQRLDYARSVVYENKM